MEMRIRHNYKSQQSVKRRVAGVLSFVALAAVLAGAAPQNQRVQPYDSETYGRSSGAHMVLEQGLLIELVGQDTADPRLRVFGGVPGNAAGIMVAGSQIEEPFGQQGVLLVDRDHVQVTGVFDDRGYYEVALSELPPAIDTSTTLYAQGLHEGAFAMGLASTFELSNGVKFYPASYEPESPFVLGDLLPRLPDNRVPEIKGELDSLDLEGTLYTALNSAGDSITLKLGGHLTVGAGANAGGKVNVEVTVERTDDDRYELALDQEAAVTAGVELDANTEAEAALGLGGKQIFSFHSIPAVVRGIWGLALTQACKGMVPPNTGYARELLASAEQARAVANQKLNEVKTRIQGIKSRINRIKAAIRATRAGSYARVRLNMALKTAERALRALNSRFRNLVQYEVDTAAAVEGARQLLQEAMEGAVRITHLMRYMVQAINFLNDHFAAVRVKLGFTAGLEAKLGIPGVSLQNVGAGIGAEVETYATVLFEMPETSGEPVLLTITRHYAGKGKASAGMVVAADVAVERSMALVDRYTLQGGEAVCAAMDVQIATNWRITGGAGVIIAEQIGIGRSVSFSMAQDDLFSAADNIGSNILAGDFMQLLETLAAVEVNLSIQDRIEWGYAGKLGVSGAGNGGGVDGAATWADQGRGLQTGVTVADAVALVLNPEKVQEMAEALGNAFMQVSN